MHIKIRLLTVLSILLFIAGAFGVWRLVVGGDDSRPSGSAVSSDSVTEPVAPLEEPRAAADLAAEIQALLEDREIAFDSGTSDLTDVSRAILDEIAGVMAASPVAELRIEAYTAQGGHAILDQGLSHARARRVREYLVAAGIAGGRLTAFGRGPAGQTVPGPEGGVAFVAE